MQTIFIVCIFVFIRLYILNDYLIEFQFQIGRIGETNNAFDHTFDISPRRFVLKGIQ